MRVGVQILNQIIKTRSMHWKALSNVPVYRIVGNKALHYVGIETILLQTVTQVMVISLHCWNFELKPMNVLD